MHAYHGCRSSTSLPPHFVPRSLPNKTFLTRFSPSPSSPPRLRTEARMVVTCRATSSSSITEFDLYDLLGIDRSSDQSQIKKAYRELQKRCHPDIAGPRGHEMAIILNAVYSLLSDPVSRSSYDKEQAKLSEFQGYTGKPLYSVWVGPETEHRAIFVDELRCVGCLKCALHAGNTFAIESVYGRARVVAQWADPEHQIVDAIRTCPVDCISFVERSDLAALEFLMSKQPRGNVRTTGSTGGARVANIFAEIEKFQRRFEEINAKASKDLQENGTQRDTRTSAMHGIRSIAQWLYWRSPASTTGPNSAQTPLSLTLHATSRRNPKSHAPNTDKLRDAAARMRSEGTFGTARRGSRQPRRFQDDNEYWAPPALNLPSASSKISGRASMMERDTGNLKQNRDEEKHQVVENVRDDDAVSIGIPATIGMFSAMVVGYRGEHLGVGLEKHVGGSMALEVVNSFGTQVALAGITWFLIASAMVGLVSVIRKNTEFRR